MYFTKINVLIGFVQVRLTGVVTDVNGRVHNQLHVLVEGGQEIGATRQGSRQFVTTKFATTTATRILNILKDKKIMLRKTNRTLSFRQTHFYILQVRITFKEVGIRGFTDELLDPGLRLVEQNYRGLKALRQIHVLSHLLPQLLVNRKRRLHEEFPTKI